MKMNKVSTFAIAASVITLVGFRPTIAFGGGQGFGKAVFQDTSKQDLDYYDSKSDLGLGKFASFPFHVSVSVRGGYDDNVGLSQFDPQGSFFTNLAVATTYSFGSPRTQIRLSAGGGVTYYFDRDDRFLNDSSNFDVNGNISFGITHKVTPRLTVAANLYATYQTQPDFETFNNSNISFSRQSQNFFYTINKFSLGYAWSPRFSTVSSYTFGYTDYDDDAVSTFQDRFEHTFGNEFRFLVLPTTTAVAEYRYGIVDYTETNLRNSTSHYVLGGIDHSFSPRLNVSARAGVEFRCYDNAVDNGFFFFFFYVNNTIGLDGMQTSPYAELTLNYAIAQSTSLSWTNRYSIEESDIPELLNRQTYRSAISLRHNFTPRIVAGLNLAYQNDCYEGNLLTPGFNEDAFDISLSVRYAINRNWAIDAGYHHTEVISDENLFREYSRNRYYLGATFSF